MMSDIAHGHGTESEVYVPQRRQVVAASLCFMALGIFFLIGGRGMPAGFQFWLMTGLASVAVLLGVGLLLWTLRAVLSPSFVSHAPPHLLADVPREPVVLEGSVVHARLTHELVEGPDGWQFRPAPKLRHNDNLLLFGFGIPILVVFAGLLTWLLHSEVRLGGWSVSAVCGVSVTALCGGTAWLTILMMQRAGFRRLPCVMIPRNGDKLFIDLPKSPDPNKTDLITGLKWIFIGNDREERAVVPRKLLRAVQLCPWKYTTTSTITCAVQGLLVIESPDEKGYVRLPILLTGDFKGAAALVHQLSAVLHVPYLFGADAEGWKTEEIRARMRPPLRVGGEVT